MPRNFIINTFKHWHTDLEGTQVFGSETNYSGRILLEYWHIQGNREGLNRSLGALSTIYALGPRSARE